MNYYSHKLKVPGLSLWQVYCFLLLACSMYTAQADVDTDLATAQKLLVAGKYGPAYNKFLYIAEQDKHPLALFNIALFYDYGWGRDIDHPLACQWYGKAARAEVPAAQHFYAECWLQGGKGIADPAKAAHWYEKAVQSGHSISLCSLAELYIEGRGVDKDPARGLALCQQAAGQGLDQAMLMMGKFHLQENKLLRDYDKAYAWFKSATERQNPEAQYFLGMMHRDGLGRERTPKVARYWFESAASQGFVPAYFQTGILYFNAPLDPVANKLHPDHLAKAYLWLSATAERSQNTTELQQTRLLLDKINKTMPAAWLPSLKEKLAQHLVQTKPK